MTICVLASCQDILTSFLYVGPLETSFFNKALHIFPRSPVKVCWWFLSIYLGSNLLHAQGTVLAFSRYSDSWLCMIIEDVRPHRLSKYVNYHRGIILFNKIRTTVNNLGTLYTYIIYLYPISINTLATLIKFNALIVKFILHLYFGIGFFLYRV